jgi:O-antigen/teichoic acid export membrane protein
MVVYTMLDPASLVASNLLIAVGYPGKLARVRLVQALFFIPVVILLGQWRGIEGVAVAANLMILLGIGILYGQVRPYVDFSAARLWLRPLLAMALTGGIVWLAGRYWGGTAVWLTVIFKGSLITGIYFISLFLLERKESIAHWKFLKNMTQSFTHHLNSKHSK